MTVIFNKFQNPLQGQIFGLKVYSVPDLSINLFKPLWSNIVGFAVAEDIGFVEAVSIGFVEAVGAEFVEAVWVVVVAGDLTTGPDCN